jgi:hypothetical protein
MATEEFASMTLKHRNVDIYIPLKGPALGQKDVQGNPILAALVVTAVCGINGYCYPETIILYYSKAILCVKYALLKQYIFCICKITVLTSLSQTFG